MGLKKIKMPIVVTPNLITSFIQSAYFLATIKIAILLILIFYAIFALIIIRQVDLMTKTFVTSISPLFRTFALIHAIFAIALVVLAAGVL